MNLQRPMEGEADRRLPPPLLFKRATPSRGHPILWEGRDIGPMFVSACMYRLQSCSSFFLSSLRSVVRPALSRVERTCNRTRNNLKRNRPSGAKPASPTSSWGAGYQTLRFKNIFLMPGGFVEGTFLGRSRNENADVGSTFRDIPLNGTANSRLSEFRGTARQSRLSLFARTDAGRIQASAYIESDFLGAGNTADEVEANNWQPRLRQYWGLIHFPSGFSFMVGQAWSLLTTYRHGLAPRAEFVPLTIDAQYAVGYNWTRQFQARVTQRIREGVWVALSVENPETNSQGVVLPTGAQGLSSSANSQTPSSLIVTGETPGAHGVSTDVAPDVIMKAVVEPGWGHWEIKAMGRFFRDRLDGANHYAGGGGVGAAALLPLHATLQWIGEGMVGAGLGRYASALGPDIAVSPTGKVVPVRAVQLLTGMEWQPTSAWNVYTYGGLEYYARTAYAGTNVGYGSMLENLSGCLTETTSSCRPANKAVWQIQPGAWYWVYHGNEGHLGIGMSYSIRIVRYGPGRTACNRRGMIIWRCCPSAGICPRPDCSTPHRASPPLFL